MSSLGLVYVNALKEPMLDQHEVLLDLRRIYADRHSIAVYLDHLIGDSSRLLVALDDYPIILSALDEHEAVVEIASLHGIIDDFVDRCDDLMVDIANPPIGDCVLPMLPNPILKACRLILVLIVVLPILGIVWETLAS